MYMFKTYRVCVYYILNVHYIGYSKERNEQDYKKQKKTLLQPINEYSRVTYIPCIQKNERIGCNLTNKLFKI